MAYAQDDPGIVQILSQHNVGDTIDRLERLLKERGVMVFARIDFSGDAARAGLTMRAQQMLIFGNPKAGTPLMQAGKRNVDPSLAINSKTPLDRLVGVITPSDLHYERSHSGVPDLDPARHRLLIHGMVKKALVLTLDDLMRLSISADERPC
jgi:DMSO/TMAO reductase YedYZ molybdopterin-dependent catalytic subunit